MNLDLDVQLQVALRALEDTIAPALGSAEKHVLEQFHLALMTIGFVKTRLPDMRRFARMELTAYAGLARESIACARDAAALSDALAHGKDVLADAAVDTAAIDVATRRLRDEVTALGSRCTDPAMRRALDRLVLAHGEAMIGQARQWASPFGFELKLEDLPPPAW